MKTHDYNSYSKDYANLGFSGSYYLAFRDVPDLIKIYCDNAKTALDYGCGAGRSTRFLKELGLEVQGVDISENMIIEARKADSVGIYKIITSGEMDFNDDNFDLIFSSFVFLEIDSLDEITKILSEMKRVLKPSGKIIFITSIVTDYKNDWVSFSYNFPENDKPLNKCQNIKLIVKGSNSSFPLYDYNWVDTEYRTAIKNAGLKVVKLHNPIGTLDDPIKWLDENKKPYFNIYILEK